MLLLLSTIKLLCEIALLALLGQGMLHLLAGARREHNPFYQLLRILTRPVTAAVRRLAPRRVTDAQLPLVAFCLLAVAWLVVTIEKIRHCVAIGMVGCR